MGAGCSWGELRPMSARLIRDGPALATRLHAPWLAVARRNPGIVAAARAFGAEPRDASITPEARGEARGRRYCT